MSSVQTTTLRVTLALMCLCGSLQAGGRFHPAPVCNGLDVPCAPKRPTYGYTPTTWRRWPSIQTSDTPTRAPEELPTPAKDRRPSVEADEPNMTPDDAPLVPTEPDATLPPPSAEPIAPPFEDTPPSPPAETEPQQSPADAPPAAEGPADAPPADAPPPLDNLFDPPSTEPAAEAAPGAEVGPPAMPAEDPFKDDPFKDDPFKDDPAPAGPPADEAPKGGTYEQRGAPALLGRRDAQGWNSPTREAAVAAEGPELKPYSQAAQPRRLSESANPEQRPKVLPVSASEKRNPLRTTSAKSPARPVVPAASWSDERPASSNVRANPLRAR